MGVTGRFEGIFFHSIREKLTNVQINEYSTQPWLPQAEFFNWSRFAVVTVTNENKQKLLSPQKDQMLYHLYSRVHLYQ